MKKGKAKHSKPKKAKEVEKHQQEPNETSQKESEFGGIPERDLKRNLGCG